MNTTFKNYTYHIYAILISTLSSCSMESYVSKKQNRLAKDYEATITITPGPNGELYPSKKSARQALKDMEKRLALAPDHIKGKIANSDSSYYYYFNPNKVKYIEKHGLQTDNMILEPRSSNSGKKAPSQR